MTFNWVKGLQKPSPDFKTYHTCRNFEKVQQWAQGVDRRYRNSDFVKPVDAVEVETYPDSVE
jgi:hypothetical protein